MSEPDRTLHLSSFARRVLVAGGIILLLLGLAALIWYASVVFLLGFAGVLAAIFLQGLAALLARHLPLPYLVWLALVLVVLVAIAVGMGSIIGPNLAEQFDRLVQLVPGAVTAVQNELARYEWGRALLAQIPDTGTIGDIGSMGLPLVGRVTGIFSAVIGVFVYIAVVGATGIYLAIQPDRYLDNMVRLVPPARRERTRQVLAVMGRALRRWLVGRFVSMGVIGVLVTVGLWLLGVPLALSLGVLTGALSFVPYLGPLLSVIPVLFVALMESPTTMFYAALLYTGVQIVESYLITPLVEARAVTLPPGLLILVQVLMGTLMGLLGLLLATPLAVVAIVLVQMLYIQDVLNDPIEPLGTPRARRQRVP